MKQPDHAMLSRLFFKLLPVQIAIVAMGSINSIVDGVIAARFIDATTVGVVGLYYTVMRILEASSSILLGGVTVLCGKSLGSGKMNETRGICTLGLVLALFVGAFLTIASFAAPETIAELLGATEELKAPLVDYIRGYAIGIIPLLLGQLLATNLQLERQEKLGHAGVIVMIVTNIALDIWFVAILDMGIWGLALATSLANWAYFLVVEQHFFSKTAQLIPDVKLINWQQALPILRIGFPNALLVACLAVRSLIINRILLSCAGNDGLSALSSFNMINGLFLSVAIGTGGLVRTLSSVFLGEENRQSLLAMIRISLTYMMAMMIVLGAAMSLLASPLAGIYFPDPASPVHQMTRQLFFIYGLCSPLSLLCIIYSNYCQAAGHRLFVNLISLFDGFFSMVIPSVLLAPSLGALGVWLSFPIGLALTLFVSVLYPVLHYKRLPRSLAEWLLLPEEFGANEGLVMMLYEMRDVTRTAETVQAYCEARGMSRKSSAHAGLCLEEIAGNIVRHGFRADRKKHEIEVRVTFRTEGVLLRIKDDCIRFNPEEWVAITTASDPASNVGIRLVYRIADEISYQNLLGLNVLSILLGS